MLINLFLTDSIPEESQEKISSCNGMLFKNYCHGNAHYSCV